MIWWCSEIQGNQLLGETTHLVVVRDPVNNLCESSCVARESLVANGIDDLAHIPAALPSDQAGSELPGIYAHLLYVCSTIHVP